MPSSKSPSQHGFGSVSGKGGCTGSGPQVTADRAGQAFRKFGMALQPHRGARGQPGWWMVESDGPLAVELVGFHLWAGGQGPWRGLCALAQASRQHRP